MMPVRCCDNSSSPCWVSGEATISQHQPGRTPRYSLITYNKVATPITPSVFPGCRSCGASNPRRWLYSIAIADTRLCRTGWHMGQGCNFRQAVNADTSTPPRQTWPVGSLTPLAWWESTWLQIGTFVVSVAAFSGYLLVGLVRRLRGLRSRTVVCRQARFLTSSGTVTALGSFLYLFFLTVGNAQPPGAVFAGRPLPWLLFQALAVVTVGALMATIVKWTLSSNPVSRGEHPRLYILITGGIMFVAWALYWGMLMP